MPVHFFSSDNDFNVVLQTESDTSKNNKKIKKSEKKTKMEANKNVKKTKMEANKNVKKQKWKQIKTKKKTKKFENQKYF